MNFPWIKRPDLIAVRHDSEGWVVKDPLTLHYALLNEAEFRIFSLLDGRLGFGDLLRRAQDIDPASGLTAEDLADFVRGLAGNQLIRQNSGGDAIRLNPVADVSPIRFLRPLLQVLRFQLNLVNPSRLIDATMPLVALLFRRTILTALFMVGVSALLIVILNANDIIRTLPTIQEFLGPQSLLLMLAIFVGVKILHESGHAFTAKYFGAECNECGVMLMVFTPVLYTNVSDSWLLPRRQRMLVTASGILVELVIASICTILWWQAAPGVTRSILLNTMILCSVNTLLFNGNPLLRFDGYFLLADWARIPNLASQSSSLLRATFVGFITGRPKQSLQAVPRKRFLLIYGVLSAAYRLLLTFAILKIVDQMSRQWHVKFFGAIMSGVIVVGFLMMPLALLVRDVWQANAVKSFDAATWRRLGAIALLMLTGLLFPLPQTLVVPAFVQPTAEAIYAPLPGRLMAAAEYGGGVSNGDVLVQLNNPELDRTMQRLTANVRLLEQELDSIRNNPATSNSALIPSLVKSQQGAEQNLVQFKTEYETLTVTSTSGGTFLPPPATARQTRIDLPQHWHGTAAESANTGAWIERGTLLGYVGESSDVRLLVAINENDVEFVQPEQSVTFVPTGSHVAAVVGKIDAVSQVEAEELPVQLAVAGLVNGHSDGDRLIPSSVTFLATVSLSESTTEIPALYSTGRVRIQVTPRSLASRIARYLRQTF